MIPFSEALRLMLVSAPPLSTERVRIEDATGRILRTPVAADRPFPPFDRVMMDGYALRSGDVLLGAREFVVAGTAAAGHEPPSLPAAPRACIEAMTGAPLPPGADCVVPVEEITTTGPRTIALREVSGIAPGRYVHAAGSDAARGTVLLDAGMRLGSRQIGAAASCGAAWLEVAALPRIRVFATGDELATVDDEPLPWQIRQSNAHALCAALQRAGHHPAPAAVFRDDPALAAERIAAALAACDWIILTGAVSKGARDFIPETLSRLGCELLFHGIAQRPGKPAGCWRHPDGAMIAALPGNPVSALTCLHALVLPALDAAAGLVGKEQATATLHGALPRPAKFTHHLPVLWENGAARPAPAGNSGDFTGLLRSDGFLSIPPQAETGSRFPYTPWL